METEQHLIDLSYLTEKERERLVAVIKADEELRIRDRIRLGTIRQEIQQQRTHQGQLDSQPQCSCCEARLGKIFNSGALCPRCGHRVCKSCRTLQSPPPPKFICSVCERQRLLDLQSSDYAVGTRLSSPCQASSISRQHSLEPQQLKQEQERDHICGSELIRKSLAILSTPGSNRPPSPVPDNKQLPGTSGPKTRPSVSSSIAGSYASSIVVRYTEREGSEDDRSLQSFTPLDEEEVTIQPAKKISLDELPEIDDDDLEEEKERGRCDMKKHPLQASSVTSSSSIGSLNSITSMYSASVGKGDYEITGEVEVGVWYRDGQLFVRVVRAKGLAAAKKGGVSDPYIKTYLLPDRGKCSKRKTSVQRKTTNPVFNEILKSKIEQHELSSRTLWLSVWDWDRFGRNQFLGEVRLPLSSLDLTDSKDRWHTLQDKDESSLHDDFYKGRLRVGLKYTPQAKLRSSGRKVSRTIGTLHITIHQAEDLPIMDEHGLTDATVKMYLLPNQSSSGKRKTQIIKHSLNPAWNEHFTYENICLEDLTSGRVLEVTVWDYDRRGSNDFIGGLRLGPAPGSAAIHKDWMDSIGDEVTHWEDMSARPGEWVERWHVLRPSMEPLGKHPTSWSPKPKKKELSPVRELSPMHELEESSSSPPPIMEGFSFSLPPTPKRSVDSSPIHQPTEAFKQAIPVGADELLLEEEEEGEQEGKEERVVPASTHEFVTAERESGKEATPTSRETTPSSEVIVTPVEEKSVKDQFGSTGSLHHKGDYEISGEVLVGVYYKNSQLHIHVERARELAAADSNGYSDPYIKTYLLPDKAKHTKQKTSVKKKTLNPVYNETLKYKYSKAELGSRTLWLSVWDWDRFGRNQFLGEVRLPLSSLDLTDTTDHWYSLLDKGVGSQTTPQSSSVTSVEQPSPGDGSPHSAGTEKHVSKHESSHVASTTAITKPPPVVSEKAEEHQPEEPQNETQKASSSLDSSPPVPTNVAAAGAPESKEDIQIETEPSSLELKHEDTAEHIAESKEPTESAVEPKISLAEIHQEYEGLPQKQHTPMARLKLTDKSSLSSFGSMTSVYSEAGGKGDYDITGEVLVGVYYKNSQLHIHVERARGLAAADSNGYSDPYIKTYLLPDKAKHTKQKTSVKKKTLNPVYNETLKYKLSKAELSSHTLWLSVWDWDRFGRNQFLGEVRLPLSSLDLTDTTDHWYSLQDKDESASGGVDAFYRGELKLSLKYVRSGGSKPTGTLAIDIKQAKELPAMIGDTTDSAVKLHLLPNRKSSGKRKTGLIKNNLSPVWEEKFTYEDVTLEELSQERVLEVSVWNYDKSGNSFIGGLRLGPAPGTAAKHKDWMDSIGDEVTHWEDMLARPGEWVEQWHTLRTSLNPRTVDLKTSTGTSAPPPPASSSHTLPSSQVEPSVASTTPVILADESKKAAPKEEKKDAASLAQSSTKSTTDEGVGEFKKTSSKLTGAEEKEAESRVPSSIIESPSDKPFGKAAPVVRLEESRAQVSAEISSSEADESSNFPAARTPTKPVFSSSVRNRPIKAPVQTTAESHNVKTLPPTSDSGAGDRAVPKTPSPRLGHGGEDETPSIRVEGERTPPTAPRAHSTPMGRGMDLSEAGSYTEESQGSDESHGQQATPPSHPKVPGLLSLKQAGSATSFGSMTSIYSEAGGKGDYDITGEVLVGVYYKNSQLHIHVERARELAAADSNGYSDPYIKTYLLPDKAKHTKQKTNVKKKTLNPVYNETLKYKYSKAELSSRTLWLSVWDWDRFGRNQFLGEVHLPLSSLDLTDTTDQWYTLQDKDEDSSADETYKGQLKLSLMYSPEGQAKKSKGQGTLHIAVQQAKDFQEPIDSFVKLYLLPDKNSSGKRKTKIIKSSLKPSWEERFTYEKVKLEELNSERVLEVTVWNFHKRSGNVFVGGLRLGPAPGTAAKHKDWMDSIGDEVTHWEDTLARPGEWVEQWHTLRTTMNPRDILLH